MYATIPIEEIKWDRLHDQHLVGVVLEIPKEYLLDEPEMRVGVLHPREQIDIIKKYGVDSKEAAELAEDERTVELLKKYKQYFSSSILYSLYCEEVQYVDSFLEKYQK